MARVKGALNARKKHKKVLKMAKGYKLLLCKAVGVKFINFYDT